MMKAKKFIKKHRISNGYDWKKASTAHKYMYYGNMLDGNRKVDSQSSDALPGNILVTIDGVGPLEMSAEMLKWLIKAGVVRVVGRSELDLDFDTDGFDFGL